MLSHFIPRKGKGGLVLALPLIIGIVVFLIFDALQLNDRYVLSISLLLSSFIIWFFDDGPALLREGINKDKKGKHTLFWIEIKYWARALGILGCILLGSL